MALYEKLFDHKPQALTADKHPEYLSSKLARERVRKDGLPLIEVQHHHAHIAACLAEIGWGLHAPPVLGVVLDGLGWGDDGTFWGGEFLLADYRACRRLGAFKPVAMPGGAQAVKEPWRNLYAHLAAGIGWPEFSSEFGGLEVHNYLSEKPRALIGRMIEMGINAPRLHLVVGFSMRSPPRSILPETAKPMRARRRCAWKRFQTTTHRRL